jgi:hypothetical protein
LEKFLKKQIPSFSLFDEKSYYFKSKNYKEEYQKSIWELNYEKPTNMNECETLTFHEIFKEIFIQKDISNLVIFLHAFPEYIDMNVLFMKLNNLLQCENEQWRRNIDFIVLLKRFLF